MRERLGERVSRLEVVSEQQEDRLAAVQTTSSDIQVRLSRIETMLANHVEHLTAQLHALERRVQQADAKIWALLILLVGLLLPVVLGLRR
jgi:polyhydroxyalkanoate synthesis regulator phasin